MATHVFVAEVKTAVAHRMVRPWSCQHGWQYGGDHAAPAAQRPCAGAPQRACHPNWLLLCAMRRSSSSTSASRRVCAAAAAVLPRLPRPEASHSLMAPDLEIEFMSPTATAEALRWNLT